MTPPAALASTAIVACAEIVTFRLVPGMTKEAFRAAAKDTLPVVQEFGGCLHRSLSVNEEHGGSLWMDYILWKDRETALKAAEVVPKDPRFAAFGAAIDPQTVKMHHSDVTLDWMENPKVSK